jgi:hypothetical protein
MKPHHLRAGTFGTNTRSVPPDDSHSNDRTQCVGAILGRLPPSVLGDANPQSLHRFHSIRQVGTPLAHR